MVSSGLKTGGLSLGQRKMCINTTIGQEERVVEEVKISMLEADGRIRNVRATISTQDKIGPDHLLHAKWYELAFEQLGVPTSTKSIFDVPVQGDINLLSWQNTSRLLTMQVESDEYGFVPSHLSHNLGILRSKLGVKLGINPVLFNKPYLTFNLSQEEFAAIDNILKNEGPVFNIYIRACELGDEAVESHWLHS